MKHTEKCKLENCTTPARRRGWCTVHYDRVRKYGDPLAGRTPNGEQRKWIDAHVSHDADECLVWPYSTARGYGYCHIDGKYVSVSRYMCLQRNGQPPTPNHEAAHLCGMGHKGCVNPKHLAWKTSLENKQDQIRHGTRQRGEKRPNAYLTKEIVRELRSRYAAENISYERLASEYGSTRGAVQAAIYRKTWAWLDP